MKQFIVLSLVAAFCMAVFAPTIAATQFDPNYWHHPEMDDSGWIEGSPRPSGDDGGWAGTDKESWQGWQDLLLNSMLYILGIQPKTGTVDHVVTHNVDRSMDTEYVAPPSGGAL